MCRGVHDRREARGDARVRSRSVPSARQTRRTRPEPRRVAYETPTPRLDFFSRRTLASRAIATSYDILVLLISHNVCSCTTYVLVLAQRRWHSEGKGRVGGGRLLLVRRGRLHRPHRRSRAPAARSQTPIRRKRAKGRHTHSRLSRILFTSLFF